MRPPPSLPRNLVLVLGRLSLVPLVLAASAATGCHRAPEPAEISIGAATSLREVMPPLVTSYEALHPGQHVTVTYAASGMITKEVEAGAPIDALFLAAARPLDDLVTLGRVDRASRRVVARNQLVLVGKPGHPPLTFETLRALPAGEVLAIGDPRTVPAGEYAHEYLTALGEWEALKPRFVYGANVAAVLVYARRGEVSAAIVYRTELRGAPDLAILDVAHGPAAPHPEVVAGRVVGAKADASGFLAFVAAPDGQKLLQDFGFGAP